MTSSICFSLYCIIIKQYENSLLNADFLKNLKTPASTYFENFDFKIIFENIL